MLARFARWRKNRKLPPPPPAARIPEGLRVYAIGDIHGRADLFEVLMGMIDSDIAARDKKDNIIILLGDLIDRGVQSRAVVERAMALAESPRDVRFLKGNHEEVFLRALTGDPQAVRFLVRIGGRSTIESYGIAGEDYEALDFEELAGRLAGCVPQAHADFLDSFEDMIEIGDYAFVHAGVRPDVPLAEQTASDMRWIRAEFLDHRGAFDRVIVHGHTITDHIENFPHRIGLDTGAYASGRLSAIALEGADRWTLQTQAE